MAKILVQTTIPFIEDDWNVSRFSVLRDVLVADGHEVVARNEELNGSLAAINHFHSYNLEADRTENDDKDNPNISFPNYHSGANGDYQRISIAGPAHAVLQSPKADGGAIDYFPAHPHEGAVGVPEGVSYARVIATGTSIVTGRPFNLAVAVEGEPFEGSVLGRAVAESTFHHFVDLNMDVDLGAPSFVGDKPGSEMKRDPARLEIYKDYIRNLARWPGVRPH